MTAAKYHVQPLPDGTGWAVCYSTASGPVIDTECNSEHTAHQLARAMNQRHRVQLMARQFHAEALKTAAVLGGPRRGVRYFEPDPFA